jgi:3-methyl-2-oxobutanoate hydroxymethyltransferase
MPLKEKVTIRLLREKAAGGSKIAMLALYDFAFATLAEQAGVDGVIVGDSVAMLVYGHKNTLQADMDMMIRHTQAVRKGGPNLFVIGDMPYMSYQPSVELAVKHAGRFMAEADTDAVKFEGGAVVLDKIQAVIKAGIPVVGHLGFTPQSAAMTGGVRVGTREADKAVALIDEAKTLEQAGICLLILEAVPRNVAEELVKRVHVPVIGIGSGPACHGQVTLAYDILGLYFGQLPRFVKKYADLSPHIIEAFAAYSDQVRAGRYPDSQHCYNMKPNQIERFIQQLTQLDH